MWTRATGLAISLCPWLGLLLGTVGCGDPRSAEAGPFDADEVTLYPRVEAVISQGCAIKRCHSGTIVGAGLLFPEGGDFWAALVNVPACQYERFALVEPGKPDASWLIVKLTAPFRGPGDPYANYIHFEPAPDWDQDARRCPDKTEAGEPLFGQRMPATAPNMLADEDLATIVAWISQGAPR